ncbi:MAG: DUF2141 domain-containing protein [Chryseosolibacter sp.]
MKVAPAFLIVLLTITASQGQGDIEVTVTGFTDREGSLRIGLFNEPHHFLKEAIDGKVVVLSADSAKVVFEDLPPGDYAVSVFHDRNGNGKLDTNALGIPKEGFAFGNNAMGMFGPPSFEKARVFIQNTTVRQMLRLRYF